MYHLLCLSMSYQIVIVFSFYVSVGGGEVVVVAVVVVVVVVVAEEEERRVTSTTFAAFARKLNPGGAQ